MSTLPWDKPLRSAIWTRVFATVTDLCHRGGVRRQKSHVKLLKNRRNQFAAMFCRTPASPDYSARPAQFYPNGK